MAKKQGSHRSQSPGRQRNGSPYLIPAVVALMVVVIVVGAIYSIVNKQPAFGNAAEQTLAQENTAQPLSTASIPYPDVPRISLQETQDKLEQGEAVLVDVRSKAAYDQSHAAEAISIPEGEIADRLGELPRDKVIILYCT